MYRGYCDYCQWYEYLSYNKDIKEVWKRDALVPIIIFYYEIKFLFSTKEPRKTCLKNQKQFSYWFPLFPSNIAFHFSYWWFLEIFLKTVKLYHSFCSSYISSRSFNIDFIIYYVYREIIAIFLTYSTYCVMEKRANRRGGHDIKVLLDYIIYRCVCP